MLRSHTCGQLSEKDINAEVTLCGWVSCRRDHGKIVFIDIRDRYGITQVVFFPKPDPHTYETAKQLKNEDVIKIKGTVNSRPEGTKNPKIPTGLIEILVKKCTVLSSCSELPFSVEERQDVGEEIRFTYRYLDLRKRDVLRKLKQRHQFNQAFRTFLHNHGFLEIETPYLSKSTPEGARDFLVPSRLNPQKFYALPQSPQLLKQILMVGGVDKYYQIVRCFRDEDLRKDRQPEFTQLDIEMSFIEEEDVFSLCEEILAKSFQEVLGKELKTPFPRISYNEAIEKYGTDKPDLGEGDHRFLWVVDFPLFEYNKDEKRWQSCHHPFTSPREEDLCFLPDSRADASGGKLPVSSGDLKDLGKVRARAYDLVLNGEEIASGSIRIHEASLQKKILQILGISLKEAEENFGFLLQAFQYAAPPHGGIALGLDRLYASLTASSSIREVIAFPKTQRGICPLTEAPSSVENAQLKELGVQLIEEQSREENNKNNE